MKIGVISDIHNNLPALEAVLQHMEDCDAIVCCGDIIGIGPYPEETVQRMMRIPHLTAVQGNHDRYLTEGLPSVVPNPHRMGEGEIGMHRWEHARLSQSSADFLRSLPLQADLSAGGLRIRVQHYRLNEQQRYLPFCPAPDAHTLDDMFAGVNADIILYGHDHAPSLQRSDRRLYVNPGSLGCPGRARSIACAGILAVENGNAHFTPLRVTYDAAPVVEAIDRAAYPDYPAVKKFFFGIES